MRFISTAAISCFLLSVFSCNTNKEGTTEPQTTKQETVSIAHQDSSIKLPGGFVASVFADSLGSARHIAINNNGDLYVKLGGLKNGHGILRLRDTNHDGVADSIYGFGTLPGTGIDIKNGFLYTSSDDNIYRYKIADDGSPDTSSLETLVAGLVNKGQHSAKAIALDDAGNVYVNIGAPSNSCQLDDRKPGSKGINPCPILDSAAGIWQFKADKQNQHYADGARYCTGIRNIVALD